MIPNPIARTRHTPSLQGGEKYLHLYRYALKNVVSAKYLRTGARVSTNKAVTARINPDVSNRVFVSFRLSSEFIKHPVIDTTLKQSA